MLKPQDWKWDCFRNVWADQTGEYRPGHSWTMKKALFRGDDTLNRPITMELQVHVYGEARGGRVRPFAYHCNLYLGMNCLPIVKSASCKSLKQVREEIDQLDLKSYASRLAGQVYSKGISTRCVYRSTEHGYTPFATDLSVDGALQSYPPGSYIWSYRHPSTAEVVRVPFSTKGYFSSGGKTEEKVSPWT